MTEKFELPEDFESSKNTYEEILQSWAQKYIEQIKSMQAKSKFPQKFDVLVSDIESEAGSTLLQIEETLSAYKKSMSDQGGISQQEIEAVSQRLSENLQQSSDIFLKSSFFDAFKVMEEQLQNIAEDDKENREKVSGAMLAVYDAMEKSYNELQEQYLASLKVDNDRLLKQLQKIKQDSDSVQMVVSHTSQKLSQLSDAFGFACEEKVKEAEKMLLDDYLQSN